MSKESRVEIWLNRALEMENRGRELYLNAAQKASDPEVVDFFKMLAEQELVHLSIIKKLSEKTDAPNWQAGQSQEADLSGLNRIFKNITAQKLSPKVGLLEAIAKGLAFESEVRDYYRKQIPQSMDAAEKDFLSRLAAEENGHYQMLSDMRLYYSDPEAWNDLQDNMHLDGV